MTEPRRDEEDAPRQLDKAWVVFFLLCGASAVVVVLVFVLTGMGR